MLNLYYCIYMFSYGPYGPEIKHYYYIIINPSKSKCITFSQKINIGSPELYMNDVKLDNVQLVKHLGHILTSDLSDDKNILHQTSMYNRKANAVLSDFKHISGNLRVKIVQSYCSSFLWITVVGLIK